MMATDDPLKRELKMPEHVAWLTRRLVELDDLVRSLERRKHRIPRSVIGTAIELRESIRKLRVKEIYGINEIPANPAFSDEYPESTAIAIREWFFKQHDRKREQEGWQIDSLGRAFDLKTKGNYTGDEVRRIYGIRKNNWFAKILIRFVDEFKI